jgi:AcrR family transcriptional regulator
MPDALPLRERNKRDKLARIEAAARELFSTNGFEATTTKAIAERAGIGTGTLFLYVKSKEELLFLIWRHEIEATIEAAFAAIPPDGPLLDQLVIVLDALCAFYARDLALSRVFLRELVVLDAVAGADIHQFTQAFVVRIAGLIGAAAARGEVRPDVDPVLAAGNCFAIYLLWLNAGVSGMVDRPGQTALLRQSLGLQLRGILREV